MFFLVFEATGTHISDPANYAPLSLLRNAFLIDTSINGVMWTLKLEVIAIPLFIVGFLLFRYLEVIALAVLLAAILVLATWKPWVNLVDTPFGLRLLPFFAVGMIVFAFGRKGSEWCPAPIAALVLVLAAVGTLAPPALLSTGFQTKHHIEMVCDGIIVGLLAFGSIGRLGKLFDHSIVRFYGRISYSFYLVNPLTLIVYWNAPGVLGRLCARIRHSGDRHGAYYACDIGRSYDTNRLADIQVRRTSGDIDREIDCRAAAGAYFTVPRGAEGSVSCRR